MKKNLIIALVIMMLMFNFTGCSTKKNIEDQNGTNTDNSTTGNQNNTNTGNSSENQANTTGKEIIGRLIGISSNEIKVSSNGKTDTYKISGDKLKDYYLGETIMLNGNGSDYDVNKYDKYNFDTRHTEAGDIITRVTGSIKEVGDKFITAITELGDIEIMNPGNFNLSKNSNVIFDYVATKEGNRLISYYDEGVKINLTIKKINRDIEGRMVLTAMDINDKEYEVTVNHDIVINVSHSSLKVGDKIKVYPISIGDENPSKINANMIIK